MACRSASISSSYVGLEDIKDKREQAYVEVHLIEVSVGAEDNVHVVQTCNLRHVSLLSAESLLQTNIFMTSEVVQ